MHQRPDVDAALTRLQGATDAVQRELWALPQVLHDGEAVELLAVGACDGTDGILAVTTSRAFFLSETTGSRLLRDLPYQALMGLRWEPGMMRGGLHIDVWSAPPVTVTGIDRRDGDEVAARLRQWVEHVRGGGPTAAASPVQTPARPAPAPSAPPPAQPGSGHSVGGVFGRRRRQAESDAARLTEQLAGMQAGAAALHADNEVLRQQLAQVMGLDSAQILAEQQRLRRAHEGLLDDIARSEAVLDSKIEAAADRAEAELTGARQRQAELARDIAAAEARLTQLRQSVVETEENALLQEAGIYEFRHRLADAVAYKAELTSLKDRYKILAKNGNAVLGSVNWQVNGSLQAGRKMVKDFSTLMLRAYNAEADAAVRTMRPHRLTAAVDRLDKSRAAIARLGATMQIRVTDEYHGLRVRELELTADHLEQQEREKEHRRELREAQREEEKLQREIQRERERLEKERRHYESALARLRASTGVADATSIAELEARLAEVDAATEAVDHREANVRAGYVYVISNVGAFGDRTVKIGLTRRLDPMDRVNELGDASVPFRFDVHALIFSEDAVGLERRLHQEFEDRRVNRVNTRREFFRVRPTEVREALGRLAGQHLLEFREEAEALEWRASGTP
ncbi:DUF4041 domain-containing protein [Streptomyces sp. NPDC000151]|uniref:DUF4041 domain-containing protein n=1 Tax=Streptomyces sp. NPDC000151 TaxID=3154244 RepID=UPI00332CE865